MNDGAIIFHILVITILLANVSLSFFVFRRELREADKAHQAELAMKEIDHNALLERFFKMQTVFTVNGYKINIRLVPNSMHVSIETTLPDDTIEYEVVEAERFLTYSHKIIAEQVAYAVTYMRLKEPLKVPKMEEDAFERMANTLTMNKL